MYLHSLRHVGSVAFTQEVAINFDALPELVAVVGLNESGKTTLLDQIPAAGWLTMPFRPGPLYKNFKRSGYTELVWSDYPGGTKYLSEVKVDVKAERVEGNLRIVGDGHVAGPLASKYLAEMQSKIGSLELFLCSAYAVQPSSTRKQSTLVMSLLRADKRDRKELLIELLGIARFMAWHKHATMMITALNRQIEVAEAKISELAPRASFRGSLEGQYEQCVAAITLADRTIEAAGIHVTAMTEVVTKIAAAIQEIVPLEEQEKILVEELAGLSARKVDLETRVERNRQLLTQKAEIEGAVARIKELEKTVSVLEALKPERDRLKQDVLSLTSRLQDLRGRQRSTEKLLEQETEIEQAKSREAELQQEVEALELEIVTARQAKEMDAQIASIEKDIVRATADSAIVTRVPCHADGVFAGCEFLGNARQAADSIPAFQHRVDELKRMVRPPMRGALADLEEWVKVARTALADVRKQAALASEVAAARAVLDEIKAQDAILTAEMERQRVLMEEIEGRITGVDRMKVEVEALRPKTVNAPHLAVAEARISEYLKQVVQIDKEMATKVPRRSAIQDKLSELPRLRSEREQATVMLKEWERTVAAARLESTDAHQKLGKVEGLLKTAREADEALTEARGALQPLLDDLSDWSLITKGVSPSGIPALLIDQALPEINALSTDLLRECYGQEVFAIELRTQRDDKDGKRLLETLDIMVTRGGAPVEAELLSGGAGVLVSEALALGIALTNAKRHGRRFYFLLRDEVGAPLDIERAPAYVRMLRRAASIGGFRHVLFVTHRLDCAQLADAVIEVKNGKVSIR